MPHCRTCSAGTLNACRVVTMRDTSTLQRSAISSSVVRCPSTPKLRPGAINADCSAPITSAMSMIWPWLVTIATFSPSFTSRWYSEVSRWSRRGSANAAASTLSKSG